MEDRFFSLHLAKAAYQQAALERKMDEAEAEEDEHYDSIYELKKEQSQELGKARFIYQLGDEESLININKVKAEIIANLPGINSAPEPQALATEIDERRTAKEFKVKQELMLIEGIDQELYSQFEGLITVYGEGKVNINTAQPEIFQVLGLSEGLVDTIIDFRKGDDDEEGTEDDEVFGNGDANSILESLRSVTTPEPSWYEQINGKFCVKSNNFNIEITAEVSGQPIKKYTIIWENNLDQGILSNIKYWSER